MADNHRSGSTASDSALLLNPAPLPSYKAAIRDIWRKNRTYAENIVAIFNSMNAADVITNAQSRSRVEPAALWKVWTWGLASYNALSLLNLNFVRGIEPFLTSGGNLTENPAYAIAYRKNFRSRSFYGMVFGLNRAVVVIGTAMLTLGIGIQLIQFIRGDNEALDFLKNPTFLRAVAIISLLLCFSLTVMAFIKLSYESKLRKLPLNVQFQAEDFVGRDVRHSTLHFAVNSKESDVFIECGEEDEVPCGKARKIDGGAIHKIRFGENNSTAASATSISVDRNGFFLMKEKPALHRTGILSKSGSYRFFYFSTIIGTFGVGAICLAALLSSKVQKFSEFTKGFFENPKMVAYAILGVVLAAFLSFLTLRLIEPICNLLKTFGVLIRSAASACIDALKVAGDFIVAVVQICVKNLVDLWNIKGVVAVSEGQVMSGEISSTLGNFEQASAAAVIE